MSGIAKGISYAEGELQVHQIHEDTRALTELLNNDYHTRAGLESESRKLAYEMEQRKVEIINERLSVEESVAAHERAVKIALSTDSKYQHLAQRSNEVMAHRDMLNATISSRENNLKGHVARMNLLGGYFTFLASLKDGENIAQIKMAENPF